MPSPTGTTNAPRISALRLGPLAPGLPEQLVPGADLDSLEFGDLALSELSLRGASVAKSRLPALSATEADFTGAQFSEVEFARLNIPTVRAHRSRWSEVTMTGRIGSFQAHEASFRSVRLVACKLGLLNLRNASLLDVEIVDCRIDELDLTHAKVRRIRFENTQVNRIELQHAALQDVDLRGATITSVDAVTNLRGTTFAPWQIADLAPLMAREVGIRIED